jgi:hypothetical protein
VALGLNIEGPMEIDHGVRVEKLVESTVHMPAESTLSTVYPHQKDYGVKSCPFAEDLPRRIGESSCPSL